MACRLRLGGNDGDTLSDEEIHQRRLAHVGVTYDIDEAGAVCLLFLFFSHPCRLFLLETKTLPARSVGSEEGKVFG